MFSEKSSTFSCNLSCSLFCLIKQLPIFKQMDDREVVRQYAETPEAKQRSLEILS